MREILFRGIRKDYTVSAWVEGGIVHQTDYYGDPCDKWLIIEGNTTCDYDIGFSWEVFPETIGQFTGRYDKNGKKVFEGDILSILGGKHRGIVMWSDHDQCYFVSPDGDVHTTLGDFGDYGRNDYYEVIGNIYDNPEILKGGASGDPVPYPKVRDEGLNDPRIVQASRCGFYGSMYTQCSDPNTPIIHIEPGEASIGADGNLYFRWGSPGPCWNIYKPEDYGMTWALTKEALVKEGDSDA